MSSNCGGQNSRAFSPQLLTQYPAPIPEIDILMNQSHSRSVNRTAFKSYRILFTLYSGWSLIFSLHFPSGNNHVCPKDWLLNQGKCYRFSMPSKTWNESQHDCAYLQAHLPVIQSLKELVRNQKQDLSTQGRLSRCSYKKCGWFTIIAFERSVAMI